MSRLIHQHMVKTGMIKEKFSLPGLSKDKHISKKEHIRYNLKRYTK